MPISPVNINPQKSILLSRNAPVALIVGVAGFLGSHLAEQLLARNIQIIGIDDFSSGKSSNLDKVIKHKQFHLINQPISSNELLSLEFPRLDYAFFMADCVDTQLLFGQGLPNFLAIIQASLKNNPEQEKPKVKSLDHPRIALISSVELYQEELSRKLQNLAKAEDHLAEFAKKESLNFRIIRLGPVFGPRMHFREKDPLNKLILAKLDKKLEQETTALDFTTRAIYISDAISLITKATLKSGTANHTYDGVLTHPIKLAEVKEVLLNPAWYIDHPFSHTQLPPWTTPNLEKTTDSLSWDPRTSIAHALDLTLQYFEEYGLPSQAAEEKVESNNFFKDAWKNKAISAPISDFKEELLADFKKVDHNLAKKRTGSLGLTVFWLMIAIILFGFVWPLFNFLYILNQLPNRISQTQQVLEQGNFKQAQIEISSAAKDVQQLESFNQLFSFARQYKLLDQNSQTFEQMIKGLTSGISGVRYLTEAALLTEESSAQGLLNNKERGELINLKVKTGDSNLHQASLMLETQTLAPVFLKNKIGELTKSFKQIEQYTPTLIGVGKIWPEISGLDQTKYFLVMLTDNRILRPGGGLVKGYGVIEVEKGKLTLIEALSVKKVDQELTRSLVPPATIARDLAVTKWSLADLGFEEDYPSIATQAKLFYQKSKEDQGLKPLALNGVMSLDLSSLSQLINLSGGVTINDEQVLTTEQLIRQLNKLETLDKDQSSALITEIYQAVITKLASVQKNWWQLGKTTVSLLNQKHWQLFVDDPNTLASISNLDWAGQLPNPKVREGNDFVLVSDFNASQIAQNPQVKKTINLDSHISQEGSLLHNLKISLNNQSDNSYKDRLNIYLPKGVKLIKVQGSSGDLTSSATTINYDHMTAFSLILEIEKGKSQEIIIDYQSAQTLVSTSTYTLHVLKQAGSLEDSMTWQLHYPSNWGVTTQPVIAHNSGELSSEFKLSQDQIYNLQFNP